MSTSERHRGYQEPQGTRFFEEFGYVLDYIPHGRPLSGRPRHYAMPTVQMLGESYFTLLEAELKHGAVVLLHERLYIGKEQREKVNRIVGRIGYEELTATAKAELPTVLEEFLESQESRFVEFFNEAQAVTPRMHAIELLPGIGKKSMWQIVDQREKRPFESFRDIRERTNVTDPAKTIARRIEEELRGESKYRLFTRSA